MKMNKILKNISINILIGFTFWLTLMFIAFLLLPIADISVNNTYIDSLKSLWSKASFSGIFKSALLGTTIFSIVVWIVRFNK